MAISIIDSSAALVSLLNDIENQPRNPPSLYLDIEGVNLSRYGSISIVQIFHLPQNHVFLIDIFVLQEAAFDTPNQSGTTLRSVLESETVPKVFFDVRNDADALYAHFNISLQGVHDVQLLELATRSYPKNRVVGLAHCIKCDARLTAKANQAWKATKDRGKALFDVNHGGSYEVFNVRPMRQDIVEYCAQDVTYLPVLCEVYLRKIGKTWLERVQDETRKRLLTSRAESYDPHGENKVLSPWAKPAKDGRKKHSGKTGVREKEKVGTLGEGVTGRTGVLSVGQVAAAKAAHRKAQKQLGGDLTWQWPTGYNEPQASRQMADLIPPQVAPTVIDRMSGRQLPLVNFPTRSKAATHGTAPAEVDTKISTAAVDAMWTCTTCGRAMLKTQQQDHMAGKKHIANLEQVKTTSDAPPQPTAAKEESSQAAPITTTRSQKKKAISATESQHMANSRQVGTDTNATFQPATAKEGPPQAAPITTTRSQKKKAKAKTKVKFATKIQQANTRKVGGAQGTMRGNGSVMVEYEQDYSYRSSAYGVYYSGGEDFNYGLCDGDCGWCGHCMNGVYI